MCSKVAAIAAAACHNAVFAGCFAHLRRIRPAVWLRAYLLILTLPGIFNHNSLMQALPFIRSFLAFQAELYIVACFYGYSILSERLVLFPGSLWCLWKDPGGLS